MSALPQTTPAWSAVTPYLLGARVTAVVPDGLDWYATVPGTSGASQPTWPTSEPWTVVDGTVTWRLATSFRQLIREGWYTLMVNFRAANPWAVKGIATSRPANLGKLDLPGIYLGTLDETVSHAQGVRTRIFTGMTAMLVVPVPDNDEASNATDTIVDALQDAFTAGYHAADGSSIVEVTSVSEVPIDEGGVPYLGNLFTFRANKAEGRN